MKIEYQDYGTVVNIVITSTFFERREHNRIVDMAIFFNPLIVTNQSGIFFMKSVLSGNTPYILRTYKQMLREIER